MGFQYERARIADHISSLNVNNLIMLSGDSHQLAIDNGTNTDYSTIYNPVGGAGFPVFSSSPMANYGNAKGGPYQQGCHAYRFYPNFQYAVVRITDAGSAVANTTNTCIHVQMYNLAEYPNPASSVLDHQVCITPDTPSWVHRGKEGGGQSDGCAIQWFPSWLWTLVGFLSLFVVFGVVISVFLCWSCGYLCWRGRPHGQQLQKIIAAVTAAPVAAAVTSRPAIGIGNTTSPIAGSKSEKKNASTTALLPQKKRELDDPV